MLLTYSHPPEYFANEPTTATASSDTLADLHSQVVQHPTPIHDNAPLYYKITLRRSIIAMPWQKRYEAGILFKKYSPEKRYKPKMVQPRLNTHTTIYREATPEVADLILSLKEILDVENIWTVEEYKLSVRAQLGRRVKSPSEVQSERGYYVVGNAADAPSSSTSTAQ